MIWEKIFNWWFLISDDWNSIWWLILNSKKYRMTSFSDVTKSELNMYRKLKKAGYNFNDYSLLNKNIEIWLTVKWKNEEDLRKNLDELRKILFSWPTLLKIKYLWEYRFLDVVCENNDLTFEHYNTYFIKTTIRFTSLLPYWSSWILERENFSNLQNYFEKNILNKWSAESEAKVYIYPTYNNWCSEVFLKINDFEIIFSVSWTERIEIDTKNFLIKVWNTGKEWKGQFNNLKVWENKIIFWVKNGELHFNLDILYEKNYV